MATKLIYDRCITVCALLIPDETPQPPTEAGITLGEVTKYPLVGPVRGDNRTLGKDFE